MMRPPFCFNICLEMCLMQLKVPFKLVSRTASYSSSFIFMSRLSFVMPALFTRMSILLYLAIRSFIISSVFA